MSEGNSAASFEFGHAWLRFPTEAQMNSNEKAERARQFFAAVPHALALSMRLESVGDGKAVISMPYNPRFVGDPETGVIHGGAVSALLDTCGGTAVYCHPNSGAGTATLTLTVNYMRPARPGSRIVAEADCHHVTRNVAFVRVTATDGDMSAPVATAGGAFTVERHR